MRPEVGVEHLRVVVGVEVSVGGVLEEAAVGIKRRLEQLPDELAKQTTTVNARLVHSRKVDELNLHAALQVWFYTKQNYVLRIIQNDFRVIVECLQTDTVPFSTERRSKASS